MIRRRWPARRSVPVSTHEAFSCWPICTGVTGLSRQASTVGREKILRPLIFESSVMMSSVTPSRRYSSSFTPERFSKYSTATDRWAAFTAPLRETSSSATRRPPESVSRFSRMRSVLRSVAVW